MELIEASLWWAEHRSRGQATEWLCKFETAIQSLEDNPERHKLARESDSFPFELRQLLFGVASKPTHRAIYRIRGKQVIVYGIRHVAQQDMVPDPSTD